MRHHLSLPSLQRLYGQCSRSSSRLRISILTCPRSLCSVNCAAAEQLGFTSTVDVPSPPSAGRQPPRLSTSPPFSPRPSTAAASKPTRKLRCLRNAYHASRAVAQLLFPLLEPNMSTPCGVTQRGQCPLTPELTDLRQQLTGTPPSLNHAGPLRDTHLIAVRDLATDAAVTRLRTTAFEQRLCASLRTPTNHLWAPAVVRRYQHMLLGARQARLREGAAFNGYQHLRETGLISRDTFCHDSLPSALTEEWGRLIDAYTAFLPDRSHIHELENLPQEVAIGELLREAAAEAAGSSSSSAGGGGATRPLDCVVDVGGGNGFLAAQVAERLGCDGVVVDPFFPAHAIDCCPRLWPDTAQRRRSPVQRRQTLHRTMALFRDVRWADVVPAPPERTALIAKHLCGSGVDEVLRQLEAQGCLPRILVLAPCCFNKITFDTYCNPRFLDAVMGVASEAALARVHRLTDWNMSCYQSTHEALLAGEEAARRRRSSSAECCSGQHSSSSSSSSPSSEVDGGFFTYQRRSGPRSIVNSITCTHAFALLVEGLLNHGRVEWLESRGYDVRLVQYVPDVVTPKNKCLLAVRRGSKVTRHDMVSAHPPQ